MTDYLECPCCGDVGAEPDADGLFYDGQPLTCGCPGLVSVEEDGEVWINNGDAFCAKCEPESDRADAFDDRLELRGSDYDDVPADPPPPTGTAHE